MLKKIYFLGEILTLRLIILWNPGLIGLNVKTQEIIAKASEKSLNELQLYFNEHNIIDWKSRLAKILLLLQPITVNFNLNTPVLILF